MALGRRDHLRSQFEEILKVGDAVRGSTQDATEAQKAAAKMVVPGSGPSLSYDEVKEISEAPLQHVLIRAVTFETPILAGMRMAIVATDEELGFITSDAPCMWYDPRSKEPSLAV